jgi:hypothetical protein
VGEQPIAREKAMRVERTIVHLATAIVTQSEIVASDRTEQG